MKTERIDTKLLPLQPPPQSAPQNGLTQRHGQDSALAAARTAYERAKQCLIAAGIAYSRTRLILQEEQARAGRGVPLPQYQAHYTCGHEGMVSLERADGSVLTICPSCQQLPLFTPIFSQTFTLHLREHTSMDTLRRG